MVLVMQSENVASKLTPPWYSKGLVNEYVI